MEKIWTVFDNNNCLPVGAYTSEESAFKAKMTHLEELTRMGTPVYNDDILVDEFDFHED